MPENGATFYKKTNVTYDTELNGTYSDYPNGNLPLTTVQGGKELMYTLMDTTIPNKPIYGAGELSELRLNVYGDSLHTGNNAGLIQMSAYMMRAPMGDNEGAVVEGTKDVTVFCSYIDNRSEPWKREDFSRSVSQSDLDAHFENIAGSVLKSTDFYIPLQIAWDTGARDDGGSGEGRYDSKDNVYKTYGDGQQIPGVGKIISVEKAGTGMAGDWRPKTGTKSFSDDMVWWDHDNDGMWAEDNLPSGYPKSNYQIKIDQEPVPSMITPYNSMFTKTRRHTPKFAPEHTEGSPKYLAYSDIVQDTQEVASGGSSALFSNIWKAATSDGGIVGGDEQVQNFYGAKCFTNNASLNTSGNDGDICGPKGRQEVFLGMKDIPSPIMLHSGNYGSGVVDYQSNTNNRGSSFYDSTIEFDIKFQQEYAHTFFKRTARGGASYARIPSGNNVKGNDPIFVSLRRATVFLMTDNMPTEQEDLYTFLSHNYCYNWQIQDVERTASDQTAGNTHTTFHVSNRGVCGNVINGSGETDVGNIAIGDRIYFNAANSYWLNHDVEHFSDDFGQTVGAGQSYRPQNGLIVTNVTTSGDTGKVTVKIIPASQSGASGDDPEHGDDTSGDLDGATDVYGTLFKYSNKNFYGMAFVNMSGNTPDINTATGQSGANLGDTTNSQILTTDHIGIIPLPFHGRGMEKDYYQAAGQSVGHSAGGETDGVVPTFGSAMRSHGWVPDATSQDFVHSTGISDYLVDGDGNSVSSSLWQNTLNDGQWFTLGFHFNPDSGSCLFMAKELGASEEDYLPFSETKTSAGVPLYSNPETPEFMPNMRAAESSGISTGKYHGDVSINTTTEYWPSNMTIWQTNCSFHNQEEMYNWTGTYQGVSSTINTQSAAGASPLWWGYEDSEIDYQDAGERDTRSDVNIDEIRLMGFNLKHRNATVSLNNPHRSRIELPSGTTRKMFHYQNNVKASSFSYGRLYSEEKESLTYLTLGVNSRTDIESASRYMLFNDFQCANIANLNALTPNTTSTAGNLVAGFTSDELQGKQITALNTPTGGAQQYLACAIDGDTTAAVKNQNDQTNRNIKVGMQVTGSDIPSNTYVTTVDYHTNKFNFTMNNAATATGDRNLTFLGGRANLTIGTHLITTGSANMVDQFLGKGFVEFDFTDSTVHKQDVSMVERENVACSARVIGYEGKTDGSIKTLMIDDPSIFHLDDNSEYVIYLEGVANSGTNRINALTRATKPTLIDKTGWYKVTMSADVSGLGGDLGEMISQGNVLISPKRSWITLEINKKGDPSSSYGTVLITGAREDGVDSTNPLVSGFRGTTFNETVYNNTDVSGVFSPYINRWRMSPEANFPSFYVDKDYGNGVWDNEKATFGDIYSCYPKVGWNELDLDAVFDIHQDITYGDTVGFMLKPREDSLDHNVKIRTTEHTTASSRPYLVTGLFDKLPDEVEDFRVSPNKDKPFFPEFTWNVNDSDLWYSFIKIDDKNISDQYHNAILHYPLNETGTDGSTISTAPTENISNSNSNTTIGGATYDIEGLAGYAISFDGASGTYIRSGTGSADPTASATSNMSAVVHAVHTTASIGTDQHLLKQDEKLIIKAIDGGKIEATVYADSNSYVTLTSTSLVPTDGETPINIIVTFDKHIKGNNVKLFIDGVLEDQTGAIVTMNDGSVSTGWASSLTQNLNSNNNYLYIGNAANNTTTGWIGKIEEIVVYSDTIYPIVPENRKFLLTTPIKELTIQNLAQSKTNVARLFVKDYHNIRGKGVEDVRASQNISWRKAGFALDTSNG